MVKKNLDFELSLWKNCPLIAGVDEAGRGALAGPLVIASVILPSYSQSLLIQDSKILSPLQRLKAYQWVKKNALEYKIILQSPRQVEQKNPLQATKEAMREAILRLKNRPDLCLVDGKEEIKIEKVATQNLIGGDRKSINIAAASIMAKVSRDAIMRRLHEKFPYYDWFNNKGYPNPTHIAAIFKYGVCELHRKTYEPIKSLLMGKSKQELYQKYKLN